MAYDYDDYWAILAIWLRSWSKAAHVLAVCDGIDEIMNMSKYTVIVFQLQRYQSYYE